MPAKRSDFSKQLYMYGITSHRDLYVDWPEGMTPAECHAMALHHGLALLGPHFVCELCGVCRGRGETRFSGHRDACDWCNGSGLTQGDGAAPAFDTQRNQVLIAASASILLPGQVEII